MSSPDRWLARGWQVFGADPALMQWLSHAGPAAIAASRTPENTRRWLRCGGTWFAGVNCLGNDAAGRVAGGGPLRCDALEAAERVTGPLALDRGQVSVVHPGYPRPDPKDSPANFRFRRDRDAAHLDGLLPIGPDRRRHLAEPHGWILGLPVTACRGGAAPLVVWEDSHEVMRAALKTALDPHPPALWPQIDLTPTYHAARREVFRRCTRIELAGQPGQAHLLHRLTLHGVAPWAADAWAPPEGRVVLYFRPELARMADWLHLP